MTNDEMMTFARAVADGGKASKMQVVEFMKALLEDAGGDTAQRTEDPVAHEEPAVLDVVVAHEPPATVAPSPFVSVNEYGAVHVKVAQFFTKREALDLGLAIVAAAKS